MKWGAFLTFATARADNSWLFRGHADTAYVLQPKVGRGVASGLKGYDPAFEKILFDEFQTEAVRLIPRTGLDRLDWLAIAQHHGVPTRLLDRSTNPFVAAWFAVSDAAGSADPKVEFAEIHAIRVPWRLRERKVSIFQPTKAVAIVRVPANAARITAQQGCFSLHAAPSSVWNPVESGFEHDSISVPLEFRNYFLSRLKVFGFDTARLMADLDGIGTDLAWSYKLR